MSNEAIAVPASDQHNRYMRKLLLFSLVFFGLLSLPCGMAAKGKPYMAPRAFHAKTYPAHETHDNEKLSIAADPFDMPDKTAGSFSIDYRGHDLLPIFLIISNDGDQAVSLSNMTVTFVTRKRTKIDPDTVDDIYRRLADQIRHDDERPRFPLPHKKTRGLSEDQQDEIQSSRFLAHAVEPHGTQAGFFYFDVQGIDTPLAGAKVVITGLADSKGNDLFFFEIPMEKYLNYQPVK